MGSSLSLDGLQAEGPKALSPGQRPQAARPEGAEALSPGQRPGYKSNQHGALFYSN